MSSSPVFFVSSSLYSQTSTCKKDKLNNSAIILRPLVYGEGKEPQLPSLSKDSNNVPVSTSFLKEF